MLAALRLPGGRPAGLPEQPGWKRPAASRAAGSRVAAVMAGSGDGIRFVSGHIPFQYIVFNAILHDTDRARTARRPKPPRAYGVMGLTAQRHSPYLTGWLHNELVYLTCRPT